MSLWVCGLVFCGFVNLLVCVFASLFLFARLVFLCDCVCDCMFVDS